MAACGIKSIDLTKEYLKILGAYYSYNQNLQTVRYWSKLQGIENLDDEKLNTLKKNNSFQIISTIKK